MDSETLIKKADDLTDWVTLPTELAPIKPLIKPAKKVGEKMGDVISDVIDDIVDLFTDSED